MKTGVAASVSGGNTCFHKIGHKKLCQKRPKAILRPTLAQKRIYEGRQYVYFCVRKTKRVSKNYFKENFF